ncbi:MAG: hypothetical protein GF370_03600 [Candidatus Nealsonbacteria bacterium]|nr:hypothetical protein [Candidatus Nealsonbacteria bacterium]
MKTVVYINKVEQLEFVYDLLQEATVLMQEYLNTVLFIFSQRYSSFPGPAFHSLPVIRKIIREGCLEQKGFPLKDAGMFFPSYEGVSIERDKDNEIVEKKKTAESPSIVEEILDESKDESWKIEGKIVYRNLGRTKFISLFSELYKGFMLVDNGIFLFNDEVEEIKEGQILPTQNTEDEFKAYAETRGEIFQVWAKK